MLGLKQVIIFDLYPLDYLLSPLLASYFTLSVCVMAATSTTLTYDHRLVRAVIMSALP